MGKPGPGADPIIAFNRAAKSLAPLVSPIPLTTNLNGNRYVERSNNVTVDPDLNSVRSKPSASRTIVSKNKGITATATDNLGRSLNSHGQHGTDDQGGLEGEGFITPSDRPFLGAPVESPRRLSWRPLKSQRHSFARTQSAFSTASFLRPHHIPERLWLRVGRLAFRGAGGGRGGGVGRRVESGEGGPGRNSRSFASNTRYGLGEMSSTWCFLYGETPRRVGDPTNQSSLSDRDRSPTDDDSSMASTHGLGAMSAASPREGEARGDLKSGRESDEEEEDDDADWRQKSSDHVTRAFDERRPEHARPHSVIPTTSPEPRISSPWSTQITGHRSSPLQDHRILSSTTPQPLQLTQHPNTPAAAQILFSSDPYLAHNNLPSARTTRVDSASENMSARADVRSGALQAMPKSGWSSPQIDEHGVRWPVQNAKKTGNNPPIEVWEAKNNSRGPVSKPVTPGRKGLVPPYMAKATSELLNTDDWSFVKDDDAFLSYVTGMSAEERDATTLAFAEEVAQRIEKSKHLRSDLSYKGAKNSFPDVTEQLRGFHGGQDWLPNTHYVLQKFAARVRKRGLGDREEGGDAKKGALAAGILRVPGNKNLEPKEATWQPAMQGSVMGLSKRKKMLKGRPKLFDAQASVRAQQLMTVRQAIQMTLADAQQAKEKFRKEMNPDLQVDEEDMPPASLTTGDVNLEVSPPKGGGDDELRATVTAEVTSEAGLQSSEDNETAVPRKGAKEKEAEGLEMAQEEVKELYQRTIGSKLKVLPEQEMPQAKSADQQMESDVNESKMAQLPPHVRFKDVKGRPDRPLFYLHPGQTVGGRAQFPSDKGKKWRI
ncbi:hypothetical protein CBR_g41231 [Chara braunii]|uniref:Uncharacterized protein n=1 Tax=Chara braunii TaxID=69332 RepID=A0A388K2M6_CHABU|nr:hypothetical protein CBR_g41231 [Chara braunii]|eukprot:GBG64312.1 hypothetical protein CBR_g41231 [Chara braunii]